MTHSNFATNNKLGLPLKAPSVQTILPIVCGGNGNLQGFFAIASHTFSGNETTFALAEGSVPVKSVTLPQKVSDGSGFGVQQYMAAVWDDSMEHLRPWIGYSAWVNPNDIGYLNRYSMASLTWYQQLNRGVLVTNLLVKMSEENSVVTPPVPPVATPAAVYWEATMDVNSAQLECAFFDVPWVTLFQAKSADNAPMSLSVVSNPPGGFFKATLVPMPVNVSGGGVEFNTIRIIKLNVPPVGDYAFNFAVTDDKGQTTPVVLTLHIIA